MGEFVLLPKEQLDDLVKKLDQVLAIVSDNAGKSRQLGDWIPEKEAQSLLGIKTTTLWTMRRIGKIKWRKIRRKVYYSKSSILQLLESGKD